MTPDPSSGPSATEFYRKIYRPTPPITKLLIGYFLPCFGGVFLIAGLLLAIFLPRFLMDDLPPPSDLPGITTISS